MCVCVCQRERVRVFYVRERTKFACSRGREDGIILGYRRERFAEQRLYGVPQSLTKIVRQSTVRYSTAYSEQRRAAESSDFPYLIALHPPIPITTSSTKLEKNTT